MCLSGCGKAFPIVSLAWRFSARHAVNALEKDGQLEKHTASGILDQRPYSDAERQGVSFRRPPRERRHWPPVPNAPG